MKKRLAVLVGLIIAIQPVAFVTGGSALACDRHPCHTACHVNEPTVHVEEDGTVVVGMPYRLIDCYY